MSDAATTLPTLEPPPAETTDRRLRPERKVEILQAVMSLLEEGNTKITTAALAKRVGVSEAALYRHYPNKAAMFQALVGYLEDHLLTPVNQLSERGGTAQEQLRSLFKYHLKVFGEHPGLCRVFLVEGIATEAGEAARRMILVVSKYRTQVKQLLRKGQASGELSGDLPVEAVAQLFVGIIQARVLNFVLSGFKTPPDGDWKVAWKQFRAILKAGG